jgi:transcriptional regulator with XRE-family HTH domain
VDDERPISLGFGALLRRHRLAAGLSQETLAERARMSVVAISALERGARQHPYRETVVLLAQALNLTPAAAAELEFAARRPRQPRSDIDPAAASGRRSRALAPDDGPTSTAAARATKDGRPQANNNLPFALTSLIGRDVELGEISSMVREHRLVTLTGAGGVGKTRCAPSGSTIDFRWQTRWCC